MQEVGQVYHIEYADRKGNVTERFVVPVTIPETMNIKAIDVSKLKLDEITAVAEDVREYLQYVEQKQKLILNFADWCEQSGKEHDSLTWRTFDPERVTTLE